MRSRVLVLAALGLVAGAAAAAALLVAQGDGISDPTADPARAVLQSLAPPGADGPIRTLPWTELRPGEWDTRTITISTAGAGLRSVLTRMAAGLHEADRVDRSAGGPGLPEAYGKVIVSDWQPGLRRVAVRVFWKPPAEAIRMEETVVYRHVARARPFFRRPSGAHIEAGAVLFDAACTGCHGVAGRGVPSLAPELDDEAALQRRMADTAVSSPDVGRAANDLDAFVRRVVRDGVAQPRAPYAMAMPPWSRETGGSLSPEAVDGLVAFVRNWHAPEDRARTAAESDTRLAAARHQDDPAADSAPIGLGAALYGSSDCLGCHGWPGAGGVTAPDLAGYGQRGAIQLPGIDTEGALRVALLAPSAYVASECPTGTCADMMPRDYGRTLTQREIELLVRYMLSLGDVPTRPPRPGAPPPLAGGLAPPSPSGLATDASGQRGRELYADHCGACHGDGGQGGMGSAASSVLASLDAVAYARAATAQGVPGMMPPWADDAGGPLDDPELDAVAAYLVQLARR